MRSDPAPTWRSFAGRVLSGGKAVAAAGRLASAALVLLCLGYAAPAGAAEPMPRFTPLPFFPGSQPSGQALGVSGDGSVAAGYASSSTTPTQAVRWTAGGIESLNAATDSRATGTNANGSVVVGSMPAVFNGFDSQQAFRWENGTATGLGTLGPFCAQCPAGKLRRSSQRRRGVVVGTTTWPGNATSSGTAAMAFRWANGTMQALGDLPGGQVWSSANGVSHDGKVVVGSSIVNNSGPLHEDFRWTAAGGITGLGYLPGTRNSQAFAANADGSVVVGFSTPGPSVGNDTRPFRWENGVMQDLGALDRFENGNHYGIAYDVSADGNTIVGVGPGLPGGGAMIWTAEKGMRTLYTVLNWDLKIDMTGWRLDTALGVSDDGLTVTGLRRQPPGPDPGLPRGGPRAVVSRALLGCGTAGASAASLLTRAGHRATDVRWVAAFAPGKPRAERRRSGAPDSSRRRRDPLSPPRSLHSRDCARGLPGVSARVRGAEPRMGRWWSCSRGGVVE